MPSTSPAKGSPLSYSLLFVTNATHAKRKTINKIIVDFVDIIATIEPAYLVEEWYTSVQTLRNLTGFGEDKKQQTSTQCVLLHLHQDSTWRALYEQLLDIIPFLDDFLTITATNTVG